MDNLIIKAAKFAKRAHAGQSRKYTDVPYISHPARVAGRLALLDNVTPAVIAAGFLHDTIEDTSTTKQDLIQEFGNEVANLVDELTNQYTKELYPELNRKQRKTKEIERLGTISKWAKIIKMIDRLDNLGEIDLEDTFAETYLDESIQLLPQLKDADPEISGELQEKIYDLKFKIHATKCSSCEAFPVSPACEVGTELLRNYFY